ncbi:MAG: hypothetical protein AB7N91_17130 [Candidatus Tectimicrobiota bacterium]
MLCLLLLILGSVPARAEWLSKRLSGPPGTPARCIVESTPLPIYDGYQETQIAIVVSAEHVLVKSKAPLDDSFGDLGLQVDKFEFIKADRVLEERSALFASSYTKLLEQFKKGPGAVKKGQKPGASSLRVQLRFWPTWPATGAHATEFLLDGFSKAHTEMLACQ